MHLLAYLIQHLNYSRLALRGILFLPVWIFCQTATFQSTLTVTTPVCPGSNGFSSVNGINISSLVRGPGLGCISHTNPVGNNADGWATGASLVLGDDDYFAFTVSGAGCPFRLDSLRLWLRKSMNFPPQRVQAYYVINNGTPLAIGPSIDISANGNATLFSLLINMTGLPALTASDQIQIRLYGWEATSNSGTLRWVSQAGNETVLYGSFPALSAGTVSSDQTICPGNSGTLNLTGYNGLIQRWEYSNSPYSTWNTIGNTGSAQAYSGLNQDTRYRALVSCGTTVDTSVYAQLAWGLASATLSGDHTICTGPAADLTVQFTGIPPWNLTWSDGVNQLAQTGISTNPLLISVNPLQSTTYTLVQVSNICGSSAAMSGTGKVLKGYAHTATLSGSHTFCGSGGNAQITVSFNGGTGPWDIQYTDGTSLFSLNGITSTARTIPVTITTHTTYSLVNSQSGVCAGNISGSAVFQVYPIPTATLSGPMILCRPNTLQLTFQLTGSPPWDLTWTDGTVQYSIQNILNSPMVMNVAGAGTGIYSILTVQDSFCTGGGGSTVSVWVADPPTATLTGNSTICPGQNGQTLISLTGVPPWDITWSDGSTSTTLTGITASNYILNVSPSATTQYQLVSVSDIQCGSGAVSGNALLTVLQAAGADLKGDTSFCAGGNGQVSVDFTGESPWSFSLEENGVGQVFSGIVQNPWVLPVSPLSTTTYRLTQVGNICGNQNVSDSVLVEIWDVPAWAVDLPGPVCAGDAAAFTLHFSGTPPWTFYYQDQNGMDSIPAIQVSPYPWFYPDTDTTFLLQLGDVRNVRCRNGIRDTITIPVFPKPRPSFVNLDSNLLVFFFPDTSAAFDSLFWSFGDGTDSRDTFPQHEYAASGKYSVGLTYFWGNCFLRKDSIIEVRKPFLDYLVLYENPNDGDFSFSVNYLKKGDAVTMGMYTREGKVIWEEEARSEGQRILKEISLKGEISPGMYFLRVINKHGIFRAKVIIR